MNTGPDDIKCGVLFQNAFFVKREQQPTKLLIKVERYQVARSSQYIRIRQKMHEN